MHPVRDVITPVAGLLRRLVIVPGKDRLAQEAQENATAMLRVLIRSHLASKPVIEQHRMTREVRQHHHDDHDDDGMERLFPRTPR